MQLWHHLEERIILPDDSETMRSRKRLAVILLLVSTTATAVNGLRYYSAGLADISLTYFALAAVSLFAFLLLLSTRSAAQHYNLIAFSVLLFGYFTNTTAHLLAGGYTSGLQIIQWTIVTLVLSVLLLDQRGVITMIVAFVAVVVVAGFLEPAAEQRLQPLPEQFIAVDSTFSMILMGLMVVGACLFLFNRVERYRRQADDLLLNILPGAIAGRLKESPETIADGFNEVSVLFADIVDFTAMSGQADPVQVVQKLNEIFSEFDLLAQRHGLEKIKTIGDAYMVAGGLPEPRADHCQAIAAFALEMVAAMAHHESWNGRPLALRVGINTGPVVAGVIGRQKFIYDLWGDAVNVASRMESNGLANEIQVTEAVRKRLDGLYEFEQRGPITVKGKGEMVTYLLRPRA